MTGEPRAPADFRGRHAWFVRRLPGQGGLGPLYLAEREDGSVFAAVRLLPAPSVPGDPLVRTRALTLLAEVPGAVDHGVTPEGDLWVAVAVDAAPDVAERIRRGTIDAREEAGLVEAIGPALDAAARGLRELGGSAQPPGLGRIGTQVVGGWTWRVLRPLGEGGIGSVYLAEREGDGWLAAVKFYAPLNAAQEEAIREAAAMRVRDPATIAVRDAGVTPGGEVWIAVDFVRGIDLRNRLMTGALPRHEAVSLICQLFRALDVLHRSGVVHADIKPENMLVEPGGRLRLVDFGRARLYHGLGGEPVFPGTQPYMHPTLFWGGAPDPRTDTFAAWVTLYELVAGLRPFTSTMLKAARGGAVPPPAAPLAEPVLDRLVRAGLSGEIPYARPSWVALERYLRGAKDIPWVRSPALPPEPRDVHWAWELARRGGSGTLVGVADAGRSILDAVHRKAHGAGWFVLWLRADWGSPSSPLSAALGLAEHAADAFDVATLGRIAEQLGPHAAVLANHAPSVRTWIGAPRATPTTGADALVLALRALVSLAPGDLLLLVDRIDLVDGATRRFLGQLALDGEVPILATAGPQGPHGLASEREINHHSRSVTPDEPRSERHGQILRRAAVLDLPFGPTLARAIGATVEEVQEAALECEACGSARWDGHEVYANTSFTGLDEERAAWQREAARRLDASPDPLLVAGYARAGGDRERLAEVIDAAVENALERDPEVALGLLDEDPRPPTPARLLRHVHVAVLARRPPRAEQVLAQLRALPGVDAADLAEAEGEVAFRAGRVVPALQAYRRAAASLGRGVGEGLRGMVEALRALWRLRSGEHLPPAPDARLARVFERLHDLQFTHDHLPMARVHELWLQAAPRNPRARAMEVVWLTALGRHARARELETALLQEMDEGRDPVGYAVVLLHRAIAQCWRDAAASAMSDTIDASAALLRVGDPYLVALCNSTLTIAAIHVGGAERLRQNIQKTARLAELVGDARGNAWVIGGEAGWRWLVGDREGAVRVAERWAEDAHARGESSEAAARRLLVELHAEAGDHAAALAEARRAEALIQAYHLQMDFYSAWVVAALVADAQARLAGGRGLGWFGRLRARWRMAGLLRTSPRWTPRALVARAWQACAAGDPARARALFDDAVAAARARGQAHDEWIALDARARALDDAAARRAADAVALDAGLKQGVTAAA